MLDVSNTMLITLNARACESQSSDPILQDAKALEIIEILKQELQGSDNPIHKKILFGTYSPKLAVTMALRSRCFDQYVNDFLTLHPQGTVINIGCGLDTRYDRIANEQVAWFDIDFPKVIDLRRRFMQETDRHRFIAASILDPSWVSSVKTKGPYLFLAEGVFMYLQEQEVKTLFETILYEFENAEIVCEVANLFWVKRMKSKYMQWKFSHQLGMTGGAVFTFGIPDSRYFEGWNRQYQFIDEWTYFDAHEKKLGWYNWFSAFEVLRKVQWTVHYRIGQ